MITLIRDGITMEVATELQASVFIRSGYTRVDKTSAPVTNENATETPMEEPKRRRRSAKKDLPDAE